VYEVAEELVSNGRLAVRTEWPPMSHRGADGRIYSIYGLLPSLIHVPGVLVRNASVSLWPDTRTLATALTSHLAAAILGGLTCVLFFGICRRQGISERAATLATLLLALGTGLFVYARSPFAEIVQTACFTGVCAELLRIGDESTRCARAGARGMGRRARQCQVDLRIVGRGRGRVHAVTACAAIVTRYGASWFTPRTRSPRS
jgi:hypothetical protein